MPEATVRIENDLSEIAKVDEKLDGFAEQFGVPPAIAATFHIILDDLQHSLRVNRTNMLGLPELHDLPLLQHETIAALPLKELSRQPAKEVRADLLCQVYREADKPGHGLDPILRQGH